LCDLAPLALVTNTPGVFVTIEAGKIFVGSADPALRPPGPCNCLHSSVGRDALGVPQVRGKNLWRFC